MPQDIRARIVIYFLIAALSIYVGFKLDNKTTPELALAPGIERSEATAMARSFLENNAIDIQGYSEYAYYDFDNSGINYLLAQITQEQFKTLVEKDTVPLSMWQVEYYKNVPKNKDEEFIVVQVNPAGPVMGFFHHLPDSTALPQITQEEALEKAKQYLQSWPQIDLQKFTQSRLSTHERSNRIDYNVEFMRQGPELAEGSVKIIVIISGDKVVGLRHLFSEPQNANVGAVEGPNLLFNTLSIIAYLTISILALVLFLKRYHEGEVGVRGGLWAGLIVYVILIAMVVNTWHPWAVGTGFGTVSRIYTKWILLGIQMVVSYVYLFTNTFTAWSVGDYEIQKSGRRLLSGVESLINRAWFTRNIGSEVPVGIAYGAILFGSHVVINYLILEFSPANIQINQESISYFSFSFPILGVISNILFFALYDEVLFRKFFTTYVSNKTGSWFKGIFIAAAGYALFNIFFSTFIVFWPRYYALIPYLFMGLIQGWVYYRYGLLASMSSGAFFVSLNAVRYWLETGHAAFTTPAYVVLLLWAAVAVYSLVALIKGKFFSYSHNSEPAHIRRIKERTRMQKELEIARRVQLGLLPKERPALEGFDVAGICVPANEVGGDYFDFIQLKDGQLGLAIADVSGKGVPAAIYMTLTKGILQSHAESNLSPKTVLGKVNSLMYRTIERSWFVSMFYAVLNPADRKMRFARAGHNPAFVINQSSKTPQLLQTAGIGLGMEMGEIFDRTLAEGELQLKGGDTLVFYTDGFTEAISEDGEEYGEERLLDFLQANDNAGASALLDKTVNEIHRFCGNAQQHDDMTMVVLKVH